MGAGDAARASTARGDFWPPFPHGRRDLLSPAEMPEGELKWQGMGTGVARRKGRAGGLNQGTERAKGPTQEASPHSSFGSTLPLLFCTRCAASVPTGVHSQGMGTSSNYVEMDWTDTIISLLFQALLAFSQAAPHSTDSFLSASLLLHD